MRLLQDQEDRIVVEMTRAEFWQLKERQEAKPLEELMGFLEAETDLSGMPEEVRKVALEFRADYLNALKNFKESMVAMLSWGMNARDQLQLFRSYLQAEQMASRLGLHDEQQQLSESR